MVYKWVGKDKVSEEKDTRYPAMLSEKESQKMDIDRPHDLTIAKEETRQNTQ